MTDTGSQPVAGPASAATRVSPDNLDSVVLVTDSRTWIAVVVGLIAVAGLIAWGFLGSIPDRTSVGAVMVREGAISRAVAPTTGNVDDVSVGAGDTVTSGQDLVSVTDTDGNMQSITSAVDGVVQAVSVEVGTEVVAGMRVVTIISDTDDGSLSAVSYVTAEEAIAFSAVDSVDVSPITADSGTYGNLEGTVSFIAQVPASTEDISAQIGNATLAQALSDRAGGTPYLIVVDFDDPPVWTETAPPFAITEGTLAEVSAITSREAPVTKLFN
ncbi:MAG: biotin/lipoyl-containing protein [Actinomycetota bacterium]